MMSKKYIVIFSVLALVVIFVGGLAAGVFIKTSGSQDEPKQDTKPSASMLRFSDLQERNPQNPKNCLATSVNPELKFESSDEANVSNLLISNIVDIPAGTNVDVYIKTYNGQNATGTSLYESTFGTYNFAAEKSKTGNWKVTDFEACKIQTQD